MIKNLSRLAVMKKLLELFISPYLNRRIIFQVLQFNFQSPTHVGGVMIYMVVSCSYISMYDEGEIE